MRLQVVELHKNGVLPTGYKLYACYDKHGKLCGCHQALRRAPWRGSKKGAPQCRAHGARKEQGCAALVDGMAARGVTEVVHQWPLQSEVHCGRQGAKRDRDAAFGRGGRYTSRRDGYIDVVFLAAGTVVLAVELDGRSHAAQRSKAGDAKKESTARRSGVLLRRLDACMESEQWALELDELVHMMGGAP